MPTASNQKLNRGDEGQSKQNYSAVRYGTDKGSIKFGTIDKKAVVCVSFTNSLPISEMDLVGRIHTGNIAIFYTVWSKEKGLGRLVLNETLNIISKRATIKRFITLSPKTEMAKRFHLSNGASLLQENFDTNNFEYKV